MTRRDLTRLFIRVFGLLLLLSTAASLPSTIYGFELQMKMWAAARVVSDLPSLFVAVTYQFGPAAIYAALGLIFMWWSGRIVDRASQVPQNDRLPVASTDLKNIEVSLVAVIGLYFLADGFAELCRFAFSQGFIYSLDGSAALKSVWTAMTGFQVSTLLQPGEAHDRSCACAWSRGNNSRASPGPSLGANVARMAISAGGRPRPQDGLSFCETHKRRRPQDRPSSMFASQGLELR
jgi:hypothetical protein